MRRLIKRDGLVSFLTIVAGFAATGGIAIGYGYAVGEPTHLAVALAGMAGVWGGVMAADRGVRQRIQEREQELSDQRERDRQQREEEALRLKVRMQAESAHAAARLSTND